MVDGTFLMCSKTHLKKLYYIYLFIIRLFHNLLNIYYIILMQNTLILILNDLNYTYCLLIIFFVRKEYLILIQIFMYFVII